MQPAMVASGAGGAGAPGGGPPGGGKGPPKWPAYSPKLNKLLMSKGTYKGKLIYIHYTDQAGAIAILNARRITDEHRGVLREGSAGGIYVNPPSQVFNPENVENLLFLGNEKYQGRGDYVVIFTADNRQEDLGPVTSGSWVKEMKIYGDVDFMSDEAVILYIGPNPFPDVFK